MNNLFTLILFFVTSSAFSQSDSATKQALDACKEGESLMRQKKYTEAYASFSNAIRIKPIPKYYCRRGACLIIRNKYDEAIIDFDHSIAIDTSYAEAYFLKATVFQFSDKPLMAINFYTKAIAHQPNYTHAYLMRGLLYATLKKKNQACEDLHKALKLGSIKAQTHINDLCGQ